MAFSRVVRFVFVLLSASGLLAGCGGGGGGGGSEPPASGISVRFSSASASFQAIEGQAVPGQTITATASGSSADAIFVGAEVLQGTAISLPIQVVVDAVARTAQIQLQPRSGLAVGTHTGRLRFLACADAACARHLAGSPFELSYTVQVSAALRFPNDTQLALAAAESAQSDEREAAVALPAAGTTLSLSTRYDSGSGWLTVRQTATGLALRASAAGLVPGTYRATVTAQGGTPLQSASLPVAFTVSNGLVVAPLLDLSLRSATPASALEGSIALGVASGVADARWQAGSNQPWFVVTTASGSGAGGIGYRLDRTALAALANGRDHVATVTVTSPAGLATQQVSVQLAKDLLSATGIDALALQPGVAGDVRVYGRFESGGADPAAYLQVSGATPLAVERLAGGGVLRVRLPALPAGEHALTLGNAAGVATPVHTIRVLAARATAYAAVPHTGPKGPLVYDPVSGSVVTLQRDESAPQNGTLVRFTPGSGGWQVATLALPGVRNIGITPDRTRVAALVAQSGLAANAPSAAPARLDLFEPATLQSRGSLPLDSAPYDASPLTIALPVTGDGRLWLARGFGWNDLVSVSLDSGEQRVEAGPNSFNFYFGPWGAATADGQRLLLTASLSISPRPPMLGLDLGATTGLRAVDGNLPFTGFSRIGMSRDGSRLALEVMEVFTDDWRSVGRITLPADWVGLRALVSRNGSRVYVYALHASAVGTYSEPATTWLPRVFVLDASAAPGSDPQDLPVLGHFDVADYPSCRVTQGPTECSPYGAQALLSDDDGTLFLAGDRFFIAVPVPAPLRPALLSPAARPAAKGPLNLKRLQ